MTGDSFIINSLILVGGIPTPLKNIGQLGLLCPMYCMEHKKCEPPTSININQHITLSYESNHEFPRLLLLCSYLHQKSPLGGPTLQYLGRKKTSSSWSSSSSSSSPSSSSSSSTKLHLSSVYHYQVLMLKPVFSNQQVIVNSPALLRCSRAAEVYPVLVDRKGLWGGAQSTRPWTKKNKRGKSLGHSGSSLLLLILKYAQKNKNTYINIYIYIHLFFWWLCMVLWILNHPRVGFLG